jgi:hypothetical protein
MTLACAMTAPLHSVVVMSRNLLPSLLVDRCWPAGPRYPLWRLLFHLFINIHLVHSGIHPPLHHILLTTMASASGYNYHRFARAVLKKARKWEPSLSIQLYPTYWRFENSVSLVACNIAVWL